MELSMKTIMQIIDRVFGENHELVINVWLGCTIQTTNSEPIQGFKNLEELNLWAVEQAES